MATITSAQTGNFSSTSTWIGGVVPGAGDDAVAATAHVVTIDTDVTVLSFQQAGTGKFVLGGGRTVTGNVIANAGTFTSGGTIDVTATTGQTATINGNVTGISSTATNVAGIVVTDSGSLILNGSVASSASNVTDANGHAGIYTNVSSSITINGSVTGGLGAAKRGVLIDVNAAFAVLTINGVVSGTTGGLSHGVLCNSSGATVNVNGNVLGGNTSSGIWANALYINITGNLIGGANNNAWSLNSYNQFATINITGLVDAIGTSSSLRISGSSAIANIIGTVSSTSNSTTRYGVDLAGTSATLTVTGDIVGGGSTDNHAIYATGASSTVVVIGSVYGAGTRSHGIRSDATSNGVIFQGDMTDSAQGAVAVYTRIFRMSDTNSGVTRYTNTVGYPNGEFVSRISPNLITGMPSNTDVRLGINYGYNNELTGTCAIPPANAVSAGVAVDNTTGTAVLTTGDVAALIGAQIAAATTTPVGI